MRRGLGGPPKPRPAARGRATAPLDGPAPLASCHCETEVLQTGLLTGAENFPPPLFFSSLLKDMGHTAMIDF